jgi:hypothetical protein
MRRREFIAGLGSAAVWPVVALAQQPAMPVIGLLQFGEPSSWDFTGFRQGLKDMGYLEGQNLAIDVRWANNDPDRLPGLAADLVHRQVGHHTAVAQLFGGGAAGPQLDGVDAAIQTAVWTRHTMACARRPALYQNARM